MPTTAFKENRMLPRLRCPLVLGCLFGLAALLSPAVAGDPKKGPRLDAHGDPLPDGALARLGTIRLRHGGEVYLVSFTPDSKAVASVSADQTFRLWDVANGKELRRFERKGLPLFYGTVSFGGKFRGGPGVLPPQALRELSFGDREGFPLTYSADGKLLALVDPRNQLLLFDTTSGKQIRKIDLRDPIGHAVALSPDGKLLACGEAGGEEHTVRLWDLANDKELPPLQLGKLRLVTKLLFAPDGKQLAGISGGHIRVWDVTTGKRSRLYEGHENLVLAIAFSWDGQKLASAGADGTVRVWESASEEEVKKFTVNDSQFISVAFTPDGKNLVAGQNQSAIHVWDIATGQEKRLLEGHKSPVIAVAVSPDGKTIASASTAGEIRLWNAATGKELDNVKQLERVESFGLLSDGHSVVTWSGAGTVRVVDLLTGAEQMNVKGPGEDNLLYEVAPGGKLAAIWNPQEDTLRLWDGLKGKELHKLPGQQGGIQSATFSADGKLLATNSGSEGNVRVWKVATGKEAFQVVSTGSAGGCAFSPDGKLLAIVLSDGDLCLVETLTGKERSRLRLGRTGGFSAMAFSPDSRLLALTLGDEVIRLWDVVQGKLLRGLVGHQESVLTLAFSPNGDVLASGSDDGTVRLWKVGTGEEVRCFEGHQGAVTRVLFAASGKAVVSGGRDGCLVLWDAVTSGKAKYASPVAKKFDQLWADLADAEGMKPFQATALDLPKETVAFLAKKLHPVPRVDSGFVEKLVADLDHKNFGVRQKATKDLEKLEGQARAALEKAFANPPSAEAHSRLKRLLDRLDGQGLSPDELRSLRAVELLVLVGSPAARELLQDLARGAPGARLTQDAAEAVKRLMK
jgi:WD40 repeat protein